MVRPTKRGVGLVAGSFVMFAIGTNIQSGWLFVLASLLLGAVAAGLLMPPLMVRRVSIQRHAPADAHAGDDLSVDLLVTNISDRRTLLSLTLRDAHVSPVRAFIPRVGPNETLIAGTTRHAARRGIVDGEPVRVSSQAPFGIGRAVRSVEAPGRTVIYPRVVSLSWLPDLASATKPLQSSTVQARKGTGQDFIGIREYRLGDSMRHVHWPSTARRGSLVVREFEQELPRRMGVIVDTSNDTRGEETALDLCCSVAGSVALFSLANAHPLTMTAQGAEALTSMSDGDAVESLTWLAGLSPQNRPPLPETIRASAAALGRLDTLVLAFPTWRDNSVEELLFELTAFEQVQTIAALVDVASLDAKNKRGMQAAEVDRLAAQLSANDVTVFRVTAGADLAACLEQPA